MRHRYGAYQADAALSKPSLFDIFDRSLCRIRPSPMHIANARDHAGCGNVVVHLYEQCWFRLSLAWEDKEGLPGGWVVGQILHIVAQQAGAIDKQYWKLSIIHRCLNSSIAMRKLGLRKAGIEIAGVHMIVHSLCHGRR